MAVTGESLVWSDSIVHLGLIFCGALGFLIFLVVLIYLKSKERIYLYYLLFLLFSLSEAFLFLQQKSIFSNFLNLSSQRLTSLVELFTLLAFSSYCFFTIRLLSVKKQDKRLYNWIRLMSIASIIYALIYFIYTPDSGEAKMLAFVISRTVIFIMSLVALIWILRKIQSQLKDFFVIGSSFYFLGAFIAVIRMSVSTISSKYFYAIDSESYFQLGILLEIISFTIALIYREYFYYEERRRDFMETTTMAVYEKEVAQAEALALRIQINPHFLFNYLNVLKYYIQIDENKKAIQYLTKFSQLIRNILNFSQESVISLKEELNLTEQYLILEGIRFDKDINFDIVIENETDLNGVMIPPMLLQPFIEEILWKGRFDVDNTSQHIFIEISNIENQLEVKIIENGGFVPRHFEEHQREINREITAERIKLYNKNYEKTISYHIMGDEELEKVHKKSFVSIKIS